MKRWVNIIAALVIVALVVGLYKAKSDAGKARANVHALERQVADAEADLRALRSEIATQESPRQIEKLAERELGARAPADPAPLDELDETLPEPSAVTGHEAP